MSIFRNYRVPIIGMLAGLLLATTSLAGASGLTAASAPVADLPTAPDELNAVALAEIAETQTKEEISKIVSMSSPDQWVQIYVDPDTFEYLAAVLIDNAPEPGVVPQGNPPSIDTISPRAVSYCDPAKGPRATTLHVAPDRTFGWCGNKTWTGTLGGWYSFTNFTSSYAYAGSSNSSVLSIPKYTTATLKKAITLGYIQLA